MARSDVHIDFGDFDRFFTLLRQAAGGDFKEELQHFLEGLGYEFLRILEDEIIRRKVVDTRELLASFHKGDKNNIWEMDESRVSLEVGTNLEYATYVNDGHWTNKKGVAVRFVPGRWQGDRFIYEKGANTGMVLKQQWVEGSHYWESALRILERVYPELLAEKLEEWLEKYFSEFI
ncbi:HK97 gp10 family phage protein [Clostridium sp. D33t1_170424_F3]|uniref:HK97 gp10 family phage protein n=1 Tax=Clostridium sp. D33t1_170424_F3 TaxID=2787099 RepID=UPI0018A8CDBA|nr:HK97 gp10 family phage protein [Clostridium sp. D33t1_170424_F3]